MPSNTRGLYGSMLDFGVEGIINDLLYLKIQLAEIKRLLNLNEHMAEVMTRGRKFNGCEALLPESSDALFETVKEDLIRKFDDIAFGKFPPKLESLAAAIKRSEPAIKDELALAYARWLIDAAFREYVNADEDRQFMWRAALEEPRIPHPLNLDDCLSSTT